MYKNRYDKVHQGTKNNKRYKMVKSRYTKVQLGTKWYKKVQKGTKRYKKILKGTKRCKMFNLQILSRIPDSIRNCKDNSNDLISA